MGLTITIRARITPELNKAIQDKAFELHLKKSDMIRFALATAVRSPMETAIDLDDFDLANIECIREKLDDASVSDISDVIKYALTTIGILCRIEDE